MSSPAAVNLDRADLLCEKHAVQGGFREFGGTDWALLSAIVAFATLIRLVFFTGFFGSDEVTYVQAAIAAAHGIWPNSSYIGAIRLGVNYPIAVAIALFGASEAVVSMWGLVCSVLEVIVVYWFAQRVWGHRLAVMASCLLALAPLHVHLAGRIMADAPLALFITLTFVLLYEAQERNSRVLWVLAGACAGFVFWIKEAPIIFVGVLIFWCLVSRPVTSGWTWAAASLGIMVAANFALLWALSGNPMLLFDAVRTSVQKHSSVTVEGSPLTFYLRYLFVDIWHTWLLGYFAAAGAVASVFLVHRDASRALPVKYVLFWSLGLLVIFSGFVISVSPFRWIPKQTNYMTIFLAPLSILGGLAIVQLKSRLARSFLLGIYSLGALLLCALEQQNIQLFTANSWTSLRYAAEHPTASIFVVTNAYRLNTWASMLAGTGVDPVTNLRSIGELLGSRRAASAGLTRGSDRSEWLAVVDLQTLDWAADDGLQSIRAIPACWERIDELPEPTFRTAGYLLAAWSFRAMGSLPKAITGPLRDKLGSLLTPLPALVYRVPETCG